MMNNLIERFQDSNKLALVSELESCSYAELNLKVDQLACGLTEKKHDLKEERIAILLPATIDYVTSLLGVWRAGGIAVPLNIHAALPELKHALQSSGASKLIVNFNIQEQECIDGLKELCLSLNIIVTTVKNISVKKLTQLPKVNNERRAMILFTSGTTNKPKGVVSTHKNIDAQIRALIEAWHWQESDVIPLFLPVHHIHGIINILCCALFSGATVHLYQKFELVKLLQNIEEKIFSVFMAVPTIYVKILSHLEALDSKEIDKIVCGFKNMRLNISGSAACPVNVYDRWLKITNQRLLERYGMTELGMAISNPYVGERKAGAVGLPLPGVDIQLVGDDELVIKDEGVAGEIRVKGDNVFLEYWDNNEATINSFKNGWFCTGDIAVIESEYFRIMGRSSIDIIKSGGYKISALEIEGQLLNHELILECAVVGVEDDTWGESVKAFLVLKNGTTLSLEELLTWCKTRMSSYKMPRSIKLLGELPRNAMGKVTKTLLKNKP